MFPPRPGCNRQLDRVVASVASLKWDFCGCRRIQEHSRDALPLKDAWRAYDEMLSDLRVVFAEEPEEIEGAWRSITQLATFSPNVWTDAYLAAFAQAANLELVTFDKGFAQYQSLRQTILS